MKRATFFGLNLLRPKVLTIEEKVKSRKEEIYGWLNEYFGDQTWVNYTSDLPPEPTNKDGLSNRRFRIYIYIGDVRFSIAAHIYERDFKKDYLGATATITKFKRGEDWTRGNDLPDGEFSKATFDSIIRGILRYSFLPLQTTSGRIEMGLPHEVAGPEVEQEVLDALDAPQEPVPPPLTFGPR